jgi:hypothetical protein
MNLKVGQIFRKGELQYTLLKTFDFDGIKLALFEIKKDTLDYEFFKVIPTDDGGVDLDPINDSNLKTLLFDYFVKEEVKDE